MSDFLNPYNFVRFLPESDVNDSVEMRVLGHCPPPPHDRYLGLTGKITLSIKAESPIFISDSEQVLENEGIPGHKSYRFYHAFNHAGNEVPAIPASSLRGMLRNIYEAATNSCFSVFEGAKLGKRLSPGSNNYPGETLAGRIEKIPTATSLGYVRIMKKLRLPHGMLASTNIMNNPEKNGSPIWVRYSDYRVEDFRLDDPNDSSFTLGYLKTSASGLPGPTSKRNEYVFIDDGNNQTFNLSFEKYNDYIISSRNNQIENTKIPTVYDTIWFRAENDEVIEFGYAQIYRKPFKYAIRDYLPKYLHTCEQYDALCPACRLFGWVHPEGETVEDLKIKTAYQGRLIFREALLEGEAKPIDEFVMAILANPKPTTAYFYLMKNGHTQYHVGYNDNPQHSGTTLRGRKMYRHQQNISPAEYRQFDNKPNKQNRTIRDALNKGADFGTEIIFENLSKIELAALVWALELEEGMYHRIGLGKPLGFGSLSIKINDLHLRQLQEGDQTLVFSWSENLINKKEELKKYFKDHLFKKYKTVSDAGDFNNLCNIIDLKHLLSSQDMDKVNYPRLDPDPNNARENYQWFEKNKRRAKVAPGLADNDSGLPYNPS